MYCFACHTGIIANFHFTAAFSYLTSIPIGYDTNLGRNAIILNSEVISGYKCNWRTTHTAFERLTTFDYMLSSSTSLIFPVFPKCYNYEM